MINEGMRYALYTKSFCQQVDSSSSDQMDAILSTNLIQLLSLSSR